VHEFARPSRRDKIHFPEAAHGQRERELQGCAKVFGFAVRVLSKERDGASYFHPIPEQLSSQPITGGSQ